jgi:hypothetical protein
MINSGTMGMPIHFGKTPKWLSERMGRIIKIVGERTYYTLPKSCITIKKGKPSSSYHSVSGENHSIKAGEKLCLIKHY